MSTFKILIDRLKGGQTHKIEELADPAFLGPEEPELRFKAKVFAKGEAYLTDDHLIVHLKAATTVAMPCAVCNNLIDVDLKVDDFYHAEPIEEIRGAIFEISEALREALLLELPRTVECKGGNCPERPTLTAYMRQKKEDRPNFPFADMNND